MKDLVLKYFGISLILLLGDFLFAVGVYFSLPNTAALTRGVKLTRVGSDAKPFTFEAGPLNKKYTKLSQISRYVPRSVLALEDSRFYQHRGFDFVEVVDALESSLEDGERLRGASTLTQQLVKNLYLSPERSFRRKILEALIAVKMEATLTKSQIIEIYLNSIDWGRGLFGIRDAAFAYYRKHPSALTLKEALFLAAIIPNPSRFGRRVEGQSPRRFVRRQMMKALRELYRQGQIGIDDFRAVIGEIQGG